MGSSKTISIFLLLTLSSCFNAANNSNSGSMTKNPDPNDESRGGNNANNNLEVSYLSTDHLTNLNSLVYKKPEGTSQTYKSLNESLKEGTINPNILLIPDPEYANDNSITKPQNITQNCGYSSPEDFNSIQERIEDCKSKNPSTFQWNGELKGNSGESKWSLVYKAGSSKFWIDSNTGLIWSNPSSKTDWNKASGFSVTDEEYICSSFKFDVFGGSEVQWRLPNRNEFLQADINGYRHVIDHDEKYFWTATTSNDFSNSEAWEIQISTGILKLSDMTNLSNVICIGEVLL